MSRGVKLDDDFDAMFFCLNSLYKNFRVGI